MVSPLRKPRERRGRPASRPGPSRRPRGPSRSGAARRAAAPVPRSNPGTWYDPAPPLGDPPGVDKPRFPPWAGALGRKAWRINPYLLAGYIGYQLWDNWLSYIPLQWQREIDGYVYEDCGLGYSPGLLCRPYQSCGGYGWALDVDHLERSYRVKMGAIDPSAPFATDVAKGLVDPTYQYIPPRMRIAGHYVPIVPFSPRSYLTPPYQPVPAPWVAPPVVPEIPFEILPHVKNVPGIRERSNHSPDWRSAPKRAPESIEVSSNGSVKTRSRHKRKRRAREVKSRAKGWGAYALARGIFHGITEAEDFVDAIWNTLPGEIKWVPGEVQTIDKKLLAIWENMDKIDVPQALENWVYNQIEDAIVGGSLGKINDALKGAGLPGGVWKVNNPILGY